MIWIFNLRNRLSNSQSTVVHHFLTHNKQIIESCLLEKRTVYLFYLQAKVLRHVYSTLHLTTSKKKLDSFRLHPDKFNMKPQKNVGLEDVFCYFSLFLMYDYVPIINFQWFCSLWWSDTNPPEGSCERSSSWRIALRLLSNMQKSSIQTSTLTLNMAVAALAAWNIMLLCCLWLVFIGKWWFDVDV